MRSPDDEAEEPPGRHGSEAGIAGFGQQVDDQTHPGHLSGRE